MCFRHHSTSTYVTDTHLSFNQLIFPIKTHQMFVYICVQGIVTMGTLILHSIGWKVNRVLIYVICSVHYHYVNYALVHTCTSFCYSNV